MQIAVLGPVQLSTDEGKEIAVPEQKVRALLAALTADAGAQLSTDALITRAWGDELPNNPKRVLQAKLSQLRRAFDLAEEAGRNRLERTNAGYRLNAGTDEVDALRFEHTVAVVRDTADAAERADRLADALSWWNGEPYDGLNGAGAWVAEPAYRLRQVKAEAVELLAEALLTVGDPVEAGRYAEPEAAVHPTRERLLRALMLAHYRTGRQSDALEAYEELRRRLAESLGADPDNDTKALHDQILRQDPSLNERSEPASPGHVRRGRTVAVRHPEPHRRTRGYVPAETNDFFGREEELATLTKLLDQSRLVTVTGIGGVGKTQLVLQAARRWAEETPVSDSETTNTAWFIELTALDHRPPGTRTSHDSDIGYVAQAVAPTIGLPTSPGDDPDLVSRVITRLTKDPALIILDNAEHVLEETAAFTSALLHATDEVCVLVTSREPLDIPSEQRFVLQPLPITCKDDDGLPPAAEFFTARARAADPGLVLDDATTNAAVELSRRLDGLPLALELAASRAGVLSVHDLLERVTDRLQLFTRPGRGAPRRQQTLRGMLDWSWSLLGVAERVLLRRLAVHHATWSLEAIEAICADPDDDEGVLPRIAVVSALARLVDASLVTVVPSGRSRRYRLLETVGAYAGERLSEAGERDDVADRHIQYFCDLAASAEPALRGPDQDTWIAILSAERTHLHHAFREATERVDGARAVQLAVSTFWYRWMTGMVAGLRDELVRAANCDGPRDNRRAEAAVLAAAMFDEETIDPDDPCTRPDDDGVNRTVSEIEAGLAGFSDDAGGRHARARVQWFAGFAILGMGLRKQGVELINDAVAVLLNQGDDALAAFAATQRDWHLVDQWGVVGEGLPDGREPEAVLRASGDAYGITQALAVNHLVAVHEGERNRAESIACEALGILQRIGLDVEASYWLIVLAVDNLRHGNRTEASELLADARSRAEDTVYTCGLAFVEAAEAVVANGGTSLPGVPDDNFADRTPGRRWIARLLPGGVPAADDAS